MPSITAPVTPEGSIVEVLVGASETRTQLLRQANLPVPQPILVRMLIDTGASNTSIAQGVLAPLGLPPTGSATLHTASSGGAPLTCDLYDVSIGFPDAVPIPWIIPSVGVLECQPLFGGIQGLIGRDILDLSVMSYNSVLRAVTISF